MATLGLSGRHRDVLSAPKFQSVFVHLGFGFLMLFFGVASHKKFEESRSGFIEIHVSSPDRIREEKTHARRVAVSPAKELTSHVPQKNLSTHSDSLGSDQTQTLTARLGESVLPNEVYSEIAKNRFYPRIAREQKIQGTVRVIFKVSESGTTEQISFESADHPILKQAAEDALKRCHFKSQYAGQTFVANIVYELQS